jgi:hypothetical protein
MKQFMIQVIIELLLGNYRFLILVAEYDPGHISFKGHSVTLR